MVGCCSRALLEGQTLALVGVGVGEGEAAGWGAVRVKAGEGVIEPLLSCKHVERTGTAAVRDTPAEEEPVGGRSLFHHQAANTSSHGMDVCVCWVNRMQAGAVQHPHACGVLWTSCGQAHMAQVVQGLT